MRSFLTIVLILVGLTTYAQITNVTKKMWSVGNGNPQELVIEESGETIRFDKQGRVVSYSIGTDEIRYSWNGEKIKLTAYREGKKLGDEYITITTQTANEIVITTSEGTYHETYNSFGEQEQSITTTNGQTLTETMHYKNDAQHTPYAISISYAGQTETANITSISRDTHGNWIKMSITAEGKTQTANRRITYY